MGIVTRKFLRYAVPSCNQVLKFCRYSVPSGTHLLKFPRYPVSSGTQLPKCARYPVPSGTQIFKISLGTGRYPGTHRFLDIIDMNSKNLSFKF